MSITNVDRVAMELGLSLMSKSQISRLGAALDEEVA
jgi:hypothetical protein